MSPSSFCRCGAGLCGVVCCKTMQDPKLCDGIWNGTKRSLSRID